MESTVNPRTVWLRNQQPAFVHGLESCAMKPRVLCVTSHFFNCISVASTEEACGKCPSWCCCCRYRCRCHWHCRGCSLERGMQWPRSRALRLRCLGIRRRECRQADENPQGDKHYVAMTIASPQPSTPAPPSHLRRGTAPSPTRRFSACGRQHDNQ